MKRFYKREDLNSADMIKRTRIRSGLSQNDLARMTGFSAASISRWEAGKRAPSVETFEAIMAALGAEIHVIVE